MLYPPFDEDFGYVTLEAFLARKPVITCTDSGGPNEFVVDGVNGCVCGPGARGHRRGRQSAGADAPAGGGDGRRRPRGGGAITWNGVIEKLVGS